MPDRKHLWLFVLCVLFVCSSAVAATATYVKIPGVPGTSHAKGRTDWIDIQASSLHLASPLVDKKVATTQCSAGLDGYMGVASANIAGLVGTTIGGDVTIEVVSEEIGVVIYQAVLKGAVFTQYSAAAGNTVQDAASMIFNRVDITTTEISPSGKPGQTRTGSFDCLKP